MEADAAQVRVYTGSQSANWPRNGWHGRPVGKGRQASAEDDGLGFWRGLNHPVDQVPASKVLLKLPEQLGLLGVTHIFLP